MLVRKFTIVGRGRTKEAFDDAIHDVANEIADGFIAGSVARGEDFAYYFDSTTDVPDGEVPL